jgi:hypothetical protein
MTSSSPASLVSARAGKAAKSMTAGQRGVSAGGARRGALLLGRPAQQPAESFPGEDLADPGAVQAGPFQRQAGADLIDRQALPAQLDHPAAGAVLCRGALAAGFPRLGEQDQLAGAEVADQGGQRGGGVAEPPGGLLQGGSLVQVGAHRLIAPLADVYRAGERLPARTRGRLRCHTADLPDAAARARHAGDRQVLPALHLFVPV